MLLMLKDSPVLEISETGRFLQGELMPRLFLSLWGFLW